MQESHRDKSSQLQTGAIVFVGLALLTAVEFSVAVGGLTGTLPLLAIVALGKAALIVEYYMHLRRVAEQGGHA